MEPHTDDTRGGLFRAEKPLSAVDRVISMVKEALIHEKLSPGDRLPSETELSRQLAVSRGSIREAMKVLSASGIVEVRRGDGTYISRSDRDVAFEPLLFSLIVSKENMRQLVELRELLEVAIVKLVLANADEDDLARIEEAVARLEGLLDRGVSGPERLAEADVAFHKALGRATRNRMVERIYSFVMDFFAPSIETTHRKQRKGTLAREQHRRIFNALRDRDLARAVKAVDESILSWKRYITENQTPYGGKGSM
ncbi:MAG: FadR/GntR family transcriptional regulator [Spirochaetota bacterium]